MPIMMVARKTKIMFCKTTDLSNAHSSFRMYWKLIPPIMIKRLIACQINRELECWNVLRLYIWTIIRSTMQNVYMVIYYYDR